MSDGPAPQGWLEVLAALDAALAELAALKRRVEDLTAERDTWRGRAAHPY